jgi:hypothetical protein
MLILLDMELRDGAGSYLVCCKSDKLSIGTGFEKEHYYFDEPSPKFLQPSVL